MIPMLSDKKQKIGTTNAIWSESFALQKECVVDYQNLLPVGAMGYDEAFVAFAKKRKALHDLTWASDRLRFIYGAPHANAHHTMTAEQQAEFIIAQCQDVDFMKETLRAGMLFVVYDNLLIGGNARQGAMMETDMWLFGRLTNVPEASHQLNNPELVDLFDAGTEDVISLKPRHPPQKVMQHSPRRLQLLCCN